MLVFKETLIMVFIVLLIIVYTLLHHVHGICVCYVSGEVPGLYTPEELEPLLSSLKDAASQDGFTGPLYNYFSYS